MRPRWGRGGRVGGDGGGAVVDFVLVGGMLLTPLVLALLQIGIMLHVRNVAAAAAAEGARYGANADVADHLGAARAHAADIVVHEIGQRYAGQVTASYVSAAGVPVVEVDVDVPVPVIGTWVAMPSTLHVAGHALVEGAP